MHIMNYSGALDSCTCTQAGSSKEQSLLFSWVCTNSVTAQTLCSVTEISGLTVSNGSGEENKSHIVNPLPSAALNPG